MNACMLQLSFIVKICMKITPDILKFDFFSSPSETFQIKEVIGSFGKSGKYYFIDELQYVYLLYIVVTTCLLQINTEITNNVICRLSQSRIFDIYIQFLHAGPTTSFDRSFVFI